MNRTDAAARSPWPACFLLLVVAAHGAAVAGLFGPAGLRGEDPAIGSDLAIHFHRAEVLRAAGGGFGLVWDPSYMGGAPVGGTTDVDNRLGELGVNLLRKLEPGAAWNWTLAVLLALVPLLVHRAARWAGASPASATIAAGLAVLLFWSTREHGRLFLTWGMYGWVLAAAATPLLFTGLQRVLDRPTAWGAFGYGLAVAFAGLAHALSALFLPLVGLLLLTRLRQLRKPQALDLSGAVLIAVILLLPAALPLFKTLWGMDDSAADLALYFRSSLDEVVVILGQPGRALANAVLLLAVAGLVFGRLSRSLAELAVLALVTTLVALFAWVVRFPAALQPTRFLLPALFLAAVPAAEALRICGRALAGRERLPRLVLLGLGAAIALPHLHTVAATAFGRRPLAFQPSAAALALERYLSENTTADARILMEDDGGRHFGGNHFGEPHLVGCLARRIDRQLIGGPHPVTVCRVGSVTFAAGRLLRRPVGDYADDELREFLRLYNIGAVVVWSAESRARFERLGLAVTDLNGGFSVFCVDDPPGFAAGADGVRAVATLDEIRVTGASASPVLLRWQYDPRFEADPPLPLGAAPNRFSPVGFIAVENGATTEFVLRYRR